MTEKYAYFSVIFQKTKLFNPFPCIYFHFQKTESQQQAPASSSITPIYFKTNTGATVKAHVDTSLINSKHSESQPCIFLLENPDNNIM